MGLFYLILNYLQKLIFFLLPEICETVGCFSYNYINSNDYLKPLKGFQK